MTHAPLQQLEFQYQPVFEASGSVAWYEALVRRRLPDGTLQSPAQFLDDFLQPSRMPAFTRFTLTSAMSLLRHVDTLTLSVNLSPEQIAVAGTDGFLHEVPQAQRARLYIEVTEDRVDRFEEYFSSIVLLADLGYPVLLDDIVPGSLGDRWRADLPVCGVKLDRSALPSLTTRLDQAALAFMAELCSTFRTVIVEGIEEPARVTQVRRLGATHFQGFGLARPGPLPLSTLRLAVDMSARVAAATALAV